MGKRDSKHKKKSSHKKKHKKEKKKHKDKKSKHHRKSPSSSDSDSTTNSSTYVDGKSKSQEVKGFIQKVTDPIQDEIGWNDLFSERHAKAREKCEQKKKEGYILEKPGQSARELNPYWKDGGNGLPPKKEEALFKFEKDDDAKSLKRLLQKAKQTAYATGVPLAKIIQEKWGSLEKLVEIVEDSENENFEDKGRSIQHDSNVCERSSKNVTESSNKRFNFMKPGEGSSSDFMNTYKRNWRKKEDKGDVVVEQLTDKRKSLMVEDKAVSSEHKSVLTPDELNALAAKKIKAEIMGKKDLAEQLGREMELAKKDMQGHSGRSEQERKKEEVVIVRKSVLEKIRKPCDTEYVSPEHSRKRQRGETHKGNERLKYFMDDNKHSLKSMFQKEKLSTDEQSDELFLKLAKKAKIHSHNDDNDLDDDFLDRVRCSDYERHESDKERNRTINEAKAEHKSLSHCRWCLEGNNVQKHLIISVGSKCYLCLPNNKSLTNGHCLIVPVHHETCGTLLDEDVWNEIHSYRNRLCRMFEDAGQDVVFFENARSFNRFPHMVLHCVPMDKEFGDLAPIYFKKAIMESETEWSNNKKLLDLRKKDLRRSVPKGLPYFAIDFGRDGGFAHVIEDEKLFPPNFAEEIIGGMLDLDAVNWRKRRKESLEGQKEKVKEFFERWKKYEDSEGRKTPKHASDSSYSD